MLGAVNAREKIMQIARRLEKHFGRLRWRSHGDPLDLLILTILSQNTNDQNRDRAYESLKKQFPTYESLVRAPTERVAEAIKVGGLHQQKAKRIQEVLKRIKAERGDYDLSYLKDLKTDEAVQELLRFDGVGKKTAGVVLTFSLNKPYFPVDTHISRITQRLGLVKPKEDAHDVMNALVPDRLKYQLHLHLIWHGRQTCKARKPLCGQCVIADLCPYPNQINKIKKIK
ncbi:MAG: endonuclease III [Candidatus Bipolaricaulota bacterium]|nr:endonuclease III [Candidatus Bipolaricaulota bacterium]MCS7273976.1 endonuclease III [Candidatus Bipolaricaulota bacterium]MDW8111329.1 endonuclease III [Candidatus Bipolaricaulota bacterium]MDW8329251.1 endonuclease III [Candidatus Bipolaricaulota bacterium]